MVTLKYSTFSGRCWPRLLNFKYVVSNFRTYSRTLYNILHFSVTEIPDFSILPLHVAQNFFITLSTASIRTINIDVELEEEKEFYVELDKKYSLAVSPSEPKYVFFSFDKNTSDTVVIKIDSEDEFCLTVSVQDSRVSCFDSFPLERTWK